MIQSEIEQLFKDYVEGSDSKESRALDLSTALEVLGDEVWISGDPESSIVFLNALCAQFSANPNVAWDIGWDVPPMLLKFISNEALQLYREEPNKCVLAAAMRCFNEIALLGNPHQCLVAACDLLINLGQSPEDGSQVGAAADSQIDHLITLRSHALFELISTVLKRIRTLHPSKYLEIAALAIIKFITNAINQIDDVKLLMRRAFAFCKGYIPPEPPTDLPDDKKLDEQELKEIIAEEAQAQVNLLRSLVTIILAVCSKDLNDKSEIKYFLSLTGREFKMVPMYVELLEIYSRFYQLSFSFDINIEEELLKIIEESTKLYDESKIVSEERSIEDSEKAINELCVEAYNYEIKKLTTDKSLQMDSRGILILCAIQYMETEQHIKRDFTIKEAICLYLRFATPSVVSDVFYSLTVGSVCRYFLWLALTNTTTAKLEEELSEIPLLMQKTLFRTLFLRNCTQPNEEVRMIGFTLITRLFCLVEEENAFQFLLECLQKCPFSHGKSCALAILKDMMTRERIGTKAKLNVSGKLDNNTGVETDDEACSDEITENLKNMTLNGDVNKKFLKKTFIIPTPKRMKDIHQAILKIVSTLDPNESLVVDRGSTLNIILFYVDLIEVWDVTMMQELIDIVSLKVGAAKETQKKLLKQIIMASETLQKCIDARKKTIV